MKRQNRLTNQFDLQIRQIELMQKLVAVEHGMSRKKCSSIGKCSFYVIGDQTARRVIVLMRKQIHQFHHLKSFNRQSIEIFHLNNRQFQLTLESETIQKYKKNEDHFWFLVLPNYRKFNFRQCAKWANRRQQKQLRVVSTGREIEDQKQQIFVDV